MSPEAEMKILNLYKNQPVRKAANALSIAEIFHAQRVCAKRIRLAGLTVGD